MFLPLPSPIFISLRSAHRGSIANLDEWLHSPPQPSDEEPETQEEEVEEIPQQPEIIEILEQDVDESGPSVSSIAEPVQPQPIQVLSDTEDFEYHTPPPSQEPELRKETPQPIPTPPKAVSPTPTPVIEEIRSASPVFDSQLFPPIPLDPSPPPVAPIFEEEAIVDVMNISDEEEAQSSDSQNDNFPRTPPPMIPSTIDTALLYRGPDQPIIATPPSPAHDPQYNFDAEFSFDPVKSPVKNELPYTLPLLNSLPPEFRKKTTRTQRKREKERERTDVRKEKEDWAPMGLARWRALLRANPTWQHLARSTKSLTTKDWNVSLNHIPDLRRFSALIRSP